MNNSNVSKFKTERTRHNDMKNLACNIRYLLNQVIVHAAKENGNDIAWTSLLDELQKDILVIIHSCLCSLYQFIPACAVRFLILVYIVVKDCSTGFNDLLLAGTNKIYKSKSVKNTLSLFKLRRFGFILILKKINAFKACLLIVTISFIIFIRVNQLSSYINKLKAQNLVKDAIEDVGEDFRYVEVYKTKYSLPKDLKFILLWTECKYNHPFNTIRDGQRAFIFKNCSVFNCYFTYDKSFFGGDLTKFDAIVFNGPRIHYLADELPKKRSPHQKYIYFSIESPDYYPVCNEVFDGFFNWTATYKLDSDLLFSYIEIRNRNGEIVGPKSNMTWVKNMSVENDFSIIQNKSKAVAWLVSNCEDRSGRGLIVNNLQKHLRPYGLSLDIYGDCGTYKCPKKRMKSCLNMLGEKYYFYLSLENTFAIDYVTEKLVTALNHNMIPIVYGGADYSRFVPPHTYLDALRMRPRELAATIAKLMTSPEQYVQYFWWKYYYTYTDLLFVDNVCVMCAALNNKTMMGTKTVHDDFRFWWNPYYRIRCKTP